MAIASNEILYKLATTAGSAGNSLAQTDPNLSLGKYISTTQWASTQLNGAINNSVTTVVVSSAAGFPGSGNYDILVESERMTVTGGQGTTTWTVTRGVSGTSAASHADTTPVGGMNLLFDTITGDQNAASQVDYRCLFVHNSNASLTLIGAVGWVPSEITGGANIAIGVDTTAASVIGSSSAQALTIANDATAPSGVTFSTPTTKGAGLSLGDIPAGQCKAIWLRRTATNSAASNADGAVIRVEGDTTA